MTGHVDAPKLCPLCGGRLSVALATIPFVLGKAVAVIKQVPAEVCDTCGEPFLHTAAADAVSSLLDKVLASNAEISLMTYPTGSTVAA